MVFLTNVVSHRVAKAAVLLVGFAAFAGAQGVQEPVPEAIHSFCKTSGNCTGWKRTNGSFGCDWSGIIWQECSGTCSYCSHVGPAVDICMYDSTRTFEAGCVANGSVNCGDRYDVGCSGATEATCGCGAIPPMGGEPDGNCTITACIW